MLILKKKKKFNIFFNFILKNLNKDYLNSILKLKNEDEKNKETIKKYENNIDSQQLLIKMKTNNQKEKEKAENTLKNMLEEKIVYF